jgi:hypothetical protein
MFKGGEQIMVRTTLSFADVCNRVAEIMDWLGPVHMSSSGRFSIEQGRHSSFFTEVLFKGDVRERSRGDGVVVTLDYEVKPSTACLVIAIVAAFTCQLVALILLFVVQAKNNVERDLNRTLDDIEDELDRRPGSSPPPDRSTPPAER